MAAGTFVSGWLWMIEERATMQMRNSVRLSGVDLSGPIAENGWSCARDLARSQGPGHGSLEAPWTGGTFLAAVSVRCAESCARHCFNQLQKGMKRARCDCKAGTRKSREKNVGQGQGEKEENGQESRGGRMTSWPIVSIQGLMKIDETRPRATVDMTRTAACCFFVRLSCCWGFWGKSRAGRRVGEDAVWRESGGFGYCGLEG